MTLALPPQLEPNWTAIRPLLTIRNEREYDRAIKRLNALLDQVGNNSRHPLFSLLDTLGTLIHTYEEAHHTIPSQTGGDILSYLMDEHGLTQSDLPEIGSQGVVSEVLNGKRDLNVRQIRALAARFGVSAAVFI